MKLEAFRKSRGLTQAELAQALGLRSKGTISMVESGLRPASADLAIKIERYSGGLLKAVDLRPALGAPASPNQQTP